MNSEPPGKSQIARRIFDDIADRYDLANLVISLGQADVWRRKALSYCRIGEERGAVLDVCCGTGAMLLRVLSANTDHALGVAIDFSRHMISIARDRVESRGLSDRVLLVEGDALGLPLRESLFDCVLTAFCLRSLESLDVFFEESYRVLKKSGVLVALELSMPSNHLARRVYEHYLRFFVEPVGNLIAGGVKHYHFIGDTLRSFPSKRELAKTMARAGFSRVRYYELSLGLVSIHVGEKL